MIRLAMLLVGARALQRQWPLIPLLGIAWMAVGALLIADITADGVLSVGIESLGALLILDGLTASLGAVTSGARSNAGLLARALAFFVLGVLILDPFDHGIPDSLLFALVFLFDGLLRAASAFVIRFRGWRWSLAAGVVEVLVAVGIGIDWPVAHTVIVPFTLGVALLATGWSIVRLGLQLRSLPSGVSITALPLYARRPWHSRPPLPGHVPDFEQAEPMTLYVWTALGTAENPQRRLLVDRYIAAVDGKGRISTGHSALEVRPDVYISHYPGTEVDHSPTDFAKILRAGPENDIPGRWIPSHEVGVSGWCEPDQQVVFRRYDGVALRSFWNEYRQDATYNLTSRSCSTATSLAIESALEGILGQHRPWSWLALLVVDPNLWLAAMLRRRGATMAWTPGLVLDYARALQHVLEHQDARWSVRFARAFRSWRAGRAQRPA